MTSFNSFNSFNSFFIGELLFFLFVISLFDYLGLVTQTEKILKSLFANELKPILGLKQQEGLKEIHSFLLRVRVPTVVFIVFSSLGFAFGLLSGVNSGFLSLSGQENFQMLNSFARDSFARGGLPFGYEDDTVSFIVGILVGILCLIPLITPTLLKLTLKQFRPTIVEIGLEILSKSNSICRFFLNKIALLRNPPKQQTKEEKTSYDNLLLGLLCLSLGFLCGYVIGMNAVSSNIAKLEKICGLIQ